MNSLARELQLALAARLAGNGTLRDSRWISAFEAVPRHVFVPQIYLDRRRDGQYALIDSTQPGSEQEWLRAVYADEPLPIEVDDSVVVSSSSQPSLMAMMLEALQCAGAERVLEIGTGSGYNAALLSEGLGSEHVASVDIDAGLVLAARTRLTGLGYAPTLAVADGTHGYAERAPYDRVIATCSVPAVPPTWITQTRPGALILVNLYRELGGGALALLRVRADGAEGRFLPFAGGFMPTRTYSQATVADLLARHQAADGTDDQEHTERPTTVGGSVLDDAGFAMFAALRIRAQRVGLLPDGQPRQNWLLSADGSWAYQTTTPAGELVAAQGGQAMLWDQLEDAHADWLAMGRPGRAEFGITVTSNGEHVLWHQRPDSQAWSLSEPSQTG